MPIPTPTSNEDHDEFISRCMADSNMQEYDESQRYAICQSSWDDKGITDMTTKALSHNSKLADMEEENRAMSQEILNKSFAEDSKVVDYDKRQVEFIATKRVVDRDGDLLEPTGMDITNFEKNPVVMFVHDIWSREALPVGKVVKIKKLKDMVKMVVEFASVEVYPFADQVYRLVKAGFLNAVSIGFIPDQNEIEIPKDMKVGGKVVERIFKKYELYELSIVPVPANQEALKVDKALKAGKIFQEDVDFLNNKQPESQPESKSDSKQIGEIEVTNQETANLTMDEKSIASLIDDMKKELQEIKNEFNQLYEEIKALNKNSETDNVDDSEDDNIYSKILEDKQKIKLEDDEFYNDIVKEKGIVGSERDHTTDQTDSFDWQDLTD